MCPQRVYSYRKKSDKNSSRQRKASVSYPSSQWGSLEENLNEKDTFAYDRKERVEISEIHHEKRGLGEFNNHRTFWRQDVQMETVHIPNEFGRT